MDDDCWASFPLQKMAIKDMFWSLISKIRTIVANINILATLGGHHVIISLYLDDRKDQCAHALDERGLRFKECSYGVMNPFERPSN